MTKMEQHLAQLNRISKKSVALCHQAALSFGVSDSALGVLYALLEAEEPCSQLDLCGKWDIPKQTVNSAVAALPKKGFLSLSPVPGTRNRKTITLTERGRMFVEETVGKLRETELAAFGELIPEERDVYIRLNEKYNRALAEKLDSVWVGAGQEKSRQGDKTHAAERCGTEKDIFGGHLVR